MAMILQFRRAEPVGEVTPPLQPPMGQTAEIIIFPGVRIERKAVRDDESPSPSRGPRRPAQGE